MFLQNSNNRNNIKGRRNLGICNEEQLPQVRKELKRRNLWVCNEKLSPRQKELDFCVADPQVQAKEKTTQMTTKKRKQERELPMKSFNSNNNSIERDHEQSLKDVRSRLPLSFLEEDEDTKKYKTTTKMPYYEDCFTPSWSLLPNHYFSCDAPAATKADEEVKKEVQPQQTVDDDEFMEYLFGNDYSIIKSNDEVTV